MDLLLQIRLMERDWRKRKHFLLYTKQLVRATLLWRIGLCFLLPPTRKQKNILAVRLTKIERFIMV